MVEITLQDSDNMDWCYTEVWQRESQVRHTWPNLEITLYGDMVIWQSCYTRLMCQCYNYVTREMWYHDNHVPQKKWYPAYHVTQEEWNSDNILPITSHRRSGIVTVSRLSRHTKSGIVTVVLYKECGRLTRDVARWSSWSRGNAPLMLHRDDVFRKKPVALGWRKAKKPVTQEWDNMEISVHRDDITWKSRYTGMS